MINFNNIKRFNFTYAITGGAWLEDSSGQREWICFQIIIQKMGEIWLNKMLRKQGWMTGCWVNVE